MRKLTRKFVQKRYKVFPDSLALHNQTFIWTKFMQPCKKTSLKTNAGITRVKYAFLADERTLELLALARRLTHLTLPKSRAKQTINALQCPLSPFKRRFLVPLGRPPESAIITWSVLHEKHPHCTSIQLRRCLTAASLILSWEFYWTCGFVLCEDLYWRDESMCPPLDVSASTQKQSCNTMGNRVYHRFFLASVLTWMLPYHVYLRSIHLVERWRRQLVLD